MAFNGGGEHHKNHSESEWGNGIVQSSTCIVVCYDMEYFQLII